MLLPMSLYAFSMTAAFLPASQHTLRLTRIMMLSPCHVEYCERLASLPRPLPICSPGLHPCLILEANQQGLGHCHAYCHTDSALPSIHSVRLKQSQRMQSSRVRSIIRLLSVPGRTSSTSFTSSKTPSTSCPSKPAVTESCRHQSHQSPHRCTKEAGSVLRHA